LARDAGLQKVKQANTDIFTKYGLNYDEIVKTMSFEEFEQKFSEAQESMS